MFPNNPEDMPITMTTMIANPHNRPPVTLISGEFDHINGKVLQPGQQINLSLLIPPGYREYICEQCIAGKEVMYIGLRDADAAEPLIHTPNFKY